ncbi:ArnT family glycosyltransferase [Tuwongella immobilis]|uniref:Glycosyltransferase RgtA/B/C/D-like domain-containing protein n=1 Tax=Tuwongella immobilis TaxID=692036 RepID=A0A6C2YNQ2_9BACT|nr:glycosyltransferase family 39 protein [Tuwongella immobilis]VIP02685.1 Uncharacterized protein OS=Candidatus Kuenenia stuttgartiensis GN=kuste3484 PE=4 SV=1: PMT_2 [Tuwongella immobilis]VTS02144.1 Uncharacterized protein OS=Candidatus Kuenenia stuttgartiensis GN=kuste3484 PE=4 SV=1: PMT_2 [Tuwongella immobilis]
MLAGLSPRLTASLDRAANRSLAFLRGNANGWLLSLWCLLLFLPGITSGTLYRTESLRARIAWEGFRGDWLVPTLYGDPFLTKPPGMYAAICLASLPFGEVTPISARIPSIVAAWISVLAIHSMLRRVLSPTQALIGAMLTPMSLLWLDKAPSAEIDMLQVMWVTLAMLAWTRSREASFAGQNRSANGWWMLAMLAVTGGVLTKWTAPAFFYLAILTVAVCDWRTGRSIRWLFSAGHLIGGVVMLIIVGAWAWHAIEVAGWDRLRDTVGAEAIQRFDPNHKGRSYPWHETLLFPWQVFAASLPFGPFALLTLRQSFWLRQSDPIRGLLRIAHAWCWPNLIFWTILPEHAVRYAFPMTPGLAILAFLAILDLGARPDWSPVMRRGLMATVAIWLGVKLAFVGYVMPDRTEKRGVVATAQTIRDAVPDDEILYIYRLKDEGVLFYYGRSAQRLLAPDSGPSDQPFYALLREPEVAPFAAVPGQHLTIVQRCNDQQGDPITVVRIQRG